MYSGANLGCANGAASSFSMQFTDYQTQIISCLATATMDSWFYPVRLAFQDKRTFQLCILGKCWVAVNKLLSEYQVKGDPGGLP